MNINYCNEFNNYLKCDHTYNHWFLDVIPISRILVILLESINIKEISFYHMTITYTDQKIKTHLFTIYISNNQIAITITEKECDIIISYGFSIGTPIIQYIISYEDPNFIEKFKTSMINFMNLMSNPKYIYEH